MALRDNITPEELQTMVEQMKRGLAEHLFPGLRLHEVHFGFDPAAAGGDRSAVSPAVQEGAD